MRKSNSDMLLTFDQIKRITVGALTIIQTAEGIRFYKCTQEQLNAYPAELARFVPRALATTGVRLDFHTDSRKLCLTFAERSKVEILIDGLLRYCRKSEPHEEAEFDLENAREKRVTVNLGCHGPAQVLEQVGLDDGATLSRHKFDSRMLFIGDSITQGWNSEHDTAAWAYKVSAFFNAESVIQGVGGDFFRPENIVPLPFDPDTVILQLGTNDYTNFTDRAGFLRRMDEYMDRFTALYGTKRVFVLTPTRRFDDAPRPAGDFASFRQLIADKAEQMGFSVIDGFTLLPPLREYYTDDIHPNECGFAIMAENVICQMLKALKGVSHEYDKL